MLHILSRPINLDNVDPQGNDFTMTAVIHCVGSLVSWIARDGGTCGLAVAEQNDTGHDLPASASETTGT